MKLIYSLLLFFCVIDCRCQSHLNPIISRLKDKGNTSNLTKLLTAKQWNVLFPNRYHIRDKKTDFYSYQNFLSAAKLFPEFLTAGDTGTQKRELAAFLANISQETSGGWATAPGGYFVWGLYFVEEKQEGIINKYADSSNQHYPPVDGKYYFGRGPKQLSWNYNYGQFSEAWYGNKDTLLLYPERLSQDPLLSFASAIWFWMTAQYPKPSCHDVMVGNWIPNATDIAKGRAAGFGCTVNIINGGIECGKTKTPQPAIYRYEYYRYFCKYLNIATGENVDCNSQQPFGQ
jgi:hypothetical protein